ncbi:YfbU family protein [Bradyrhizobium sp. USDA 3315]
MKMTDGEKLIVLMLADISKRLQGEPEVDPDFVAQTIYADQLWGFDWHFSGIPFERSEEPNPVVKETVSILEMFSSTMYQFQQLENSERQRVCDDVGFAAHGLDIFPGFDGNHDPHYGVANYLVKDLHRFKDVPGATNNSHTQTSLPQYCKMLLVYLPMRTKLGTGRFSKEDIIAIFKGG